MIANRRKRAKIITSSTEVFTNFFLELKESYSGRLVIFEPENPSGNLISFDRSLHRRPSVTGGNTRCLQLTGAGCRLIEFDPEIHGEMT